MKNIILFCLLISSSFISVFADNNSNSQIENEPLYCTKDYNPVCWTNWITYWNLCSAWKNIVAYNWECDSFVNNNYYFRLKTFRVLEFKSLLSDYSERNLNILMSKLDLKIEDVKNSKLNIWEKIKRVTFYRFIKNIIPETINRNNFYQWKEKVEFDDATYKINWKYVTFVNWISKENSITTKYFWNKVKWDFNNDGTEDIAFLITQDTWGSGIFYYVVTALLLNNGYEWTNAIFLWDRIAPQSSNYINDYIVINYADRKETESMNVKPSIWTSKYFKIINDKLVEYTK